MTSKYRRALRALPAIALLGLLMGCTEYGDATYNASFTDRGNYFIQYNESVDIERTTDGVVHIYAKKTSGKSTSDIKISGTGQFAVHGCDSLKVTNGAHVEVHDCATVRALPSTEVVAFNCATIYAPPGLPLEVHGAATVNRLEAAVGNNGVLAIDMPEVGKEPSFPPKR